MRGAVAVAMLLLSALPVAAQMRMTVAQLESFIRSSVELRHPDRQVAEYLRKTTLTERLNPSRMEDLVAVGAGPKTIEALQQMSQASASLSEPAPPPSAVVRTPIPPPSAAEQKRVLDEVREYALGYTKRLPDFLCTQVTRRYIDPSGLEFWQRQDVITTRLSFFEQKEDYKVMLVNNQPVTTGSLHSLGGTTTSGEFGTMLKEIFEPEMQGEFHWERWATLRGRRVHVFNYRIGEARTKYTIRYVGSLSDSVITVPYRGLVYVDAEYPMIHRITIEAEHIPATFPIQNVATVLDYDTVNIAGNDYILPLRAVNRSRSGKLLTKNEVEFRMYRKFTAEATITFDTPEPLPEEKTQEQPAKPQP